jgi:hypothetical protein
VGAAAGANLIDGSHFDNPRAAAGALERGRGIRPAAIRYFPSTVAWKKFMQRIAGLIGGRFVEFHMTPAIPDRRLQDRKVEREIGVGIDDEPNRGAWLTVDETLL